MTVNKNLILKMIKKALWYNLQRIAVKNDKKILGYNLQRISVYGFYGGTEVERRYGGRAKIQFRHYISASVKSMKILTSVISHCGLYGGF